MMDKLTVAQMVLSFSTMLIAGLLISRMFFLFIVMLAIIGALSLVGIYYDPVYYYLHSGYEFIRDILTRSGFTLLAGLFGLIVGLSLSNNKKRRYK